MIDTSKTAKHRKLHFDDVAELRAELAQIAAAQRAGTLRQSGNWTAGQIFGHLAAFIDYGYEGYPAELANPPWFVKLIVRMTRKSYLHKPMRAGVRIPGTRDGTTGTDALAFDEGLARLERAWKRLEAQRPTVPGVFGNLSHAERILLNLRHAELHLGFLHRDEP